MTGVYVPDNRRWRLFQLAFILLNLPSVTDLHHSDRSHATDAIADLLWFATGGGKTEAYLGLTAYVLALRRLQGVIEGRRGDYGVAILMRYTLRLLTASNSSAPPPCCAPAKSSAAKIRQRGVNRPGNSGG